LITREQGYVVFNCNLYFRYRPCFNLHINPLPALTYQNVLDLNVACRPKRTQTYWLSSS
jgi:hypothetical protein